MPCGPGGAESFDLIRFRCFGLGSLAVYAAKLEVRPQLHLARSLTGRWSAILQYSFGSGFPIIATYT